VASDQLLKGILILATIVLHVGDSAALTNGDIAVRDRLQNTLLHTVSVLDDGAAQAATGTYDAVVIAESCASGAMAGKYLTVTTGVMISEGALWDDFGLTSVASSTSQSDDQWDVTGGTQISGGLSGTQTVFSAVTACHNSLTSDIAAAATVTAVLSNAITRATVYYLAQGQSRAGGGAAVEGHRVAFGMTDAGAQVAQAAAWTLFDATIAWFVGSGVNTARRTGGFLGLLA
jgi:hypothetical protein